MNRRQLLQTSLAAPLAFTQSAYAAPAAKTVIDKIEVFQVKVNHRGNWVLVRLTTTEGITGLGDASHGTDPNVLPLLKTFFANLKGRSAFDVEPLRGALWPEVQRNGRPGVVAFGGLEHAMHDIQGKALGVPVWALFGGKLHARIRHYANINRTVTERTPDGFSRVAELARKAGFTAIKMASFDGMPRNDVSKIPAFTQIGIDCIAGVRKTIGPASDLLVDAHSNFDLHRGLELAQRLEPMKLFWLEEVCRATPDLAAINKAAVMPTAGGESIFGTIGYFPYIKAEAVDIVMPDIKYCGGLLETKKIAAIAEAAGMPCSPHGPASPIGNIAAAHVCATLPNFQILELGYGETEWRAELIDPPEAFDKGYLTVPDKPGFGVSLNEKTAAKHAV
ncbi:MAG: mandelate racemase/muconate lactonizing enzyme family protein [Acidobacteriia bacterium]|nr:mandelate racemase/muconate lactonizing enzyme family protein [Terriglobia bacterium]